MNPMLATYPNRQYRNLLDIVPPGRYGTAEVRHADVTAQESARNFLHEGAAAVPPGRYCQLYLDGQLFMTDTPEERRTNRPIVERARGNVLIGGLGLGLILPPLISAPEVTSITVLERSAAVLALVAPHYRVGASYWAETFAAYRLHKLRFIEADVFTWVLDQKFQTIWFDIWPLIQLENLPEMAALRRRYRQASGSSWLGCWCESELKTLVNIQKLKQEVW
jgi:hypothetical protein